MLAAAVLLTPSFAQTPTFRSDVNLVTITFTARNGDGKLVGDLSAADIEVLEDAVPQKISFFARTSDLPLAIGLIVDVSDSQHKFYRRHRDDVEKFLKQVLGPRDQAFLLCFENHLRLVSDLTNSVSQIMDGFERFDHGNRHFPEIGPREDRELGTAFYDSIYYSVTEKLAKVGQARRALIMFSDGEDNSSAHHMIDAIEAAQAADVLIYCVRYTDAKPNHLNARNKYGISVMRRLARDTGAVEFDATGGDIDQAFRDIGVELRSLYEVAYHSSAQRDGTFRKVVISTNRPGLTTRAKAGYFAER